MLAVFPGPEYYFLCLYKMPDGGSKLPFPVLRGLQQHAVA